MEKQHVVIYLEEYDKLKASNTKLQEVETELKLRDDMLNRLEQATSEMIRDFGSQTTRRQPDDYFEGHGIGIDFKYNISDIVNSRVKFTYRF